MRLKKLLLVCYIVLALAFALPFFLKAPAKEQSEAPAALFTQDAAPAVGAAKSELWQSVRVKTGEGVRELGMTEYLIGVLGAEMPASFETEALRAQAVAARTYAMYCAASARHTDAQVCTSSGCCQAWLNDEELAERLGAEHEKYYAKLKAAVEDTAGEYLGYDGQPALAAFHSSSAGATEASGQVWSAVPYLVSVSSPETSEDVPGYVSTVELTALDFRDSILSLCPTADMTGAPESWLGETMRDASGRVESLAIGGERFTGAQMRQLFSLRSTAFELECTQTGFRFTVTGFGHGVGMSQYGANVMAREGAGYKEILAHYYPGTALLCR